MARKTIAEAGVWNREIERAERVLGRIGPDDLCCEGLTPRQAAILRILVEREGARLSDLATAADITPSAMTRNLEKLEKRGLVSRLRGTRDDGRAATVGITAEGRRIRARIDQMMSDRAAAIAHAIPPSQRAQVLSALQLFNSALEQAGCCGPNFCCDTPGNVLTNIAGVPPAARRR
jgi:DNA-binding MarR family transcriptional regulator